MVQSDQYHAEMRRQAVQQHGICRQLRSIECIGILQCRFQSRQKHPVFLFVDVQGTGLFLRRDVPRQVFRFPKGEFQRPDAAGCLCHGAGQLPEVLRHGISVRQDPARADPARRDLQMQQQILDPVFIQTGTFCFQQIPDPVREQLCRSFVKSEIRSDLPGSCPVNQAVPDLFLRSAQPQSFTAAGQCQVEWFQFIFQNIQIVFDSGFADVQPVSQRLYRGGSVHEKPRGEPVHPLGLCVRDPGL